MLVRLDTKKKSKNPNFCSFCTTSDYEVKKDPNSNSEKEFASCSLTYPSERLMSHSFDERFLKLLYFLPEILSQTQKNYDQDENIRGKLFQKKLIEKI